MASVKSPSEERRLLPHREEHAGRPTGGEQCHLHDIARPLLGRQEPRVPGHVGPDVAGVRAVDAQLRVPPRHDPRVGVHGRLGHLVRRELVRPPASLQCGRPSLEVLEERVQQLVQPLLGEVAGVVQLLLQLLAPEVLPQAGKRKKLWSEFISQTDFSYLFEVG